MVVWAGPRATSPRSCPPPRLPKSTPFVRTSSTARSLLPKIQKPSQPGRLRPATRLCFRIDYQPPASRRGSCVARPVQLPVSKHGSHVCATILTVRLFCYGGEQMRRLLSVVLILALAASVFTGCKKTTPVVNEIKIGLVTDVGGRGDQSFNDSALRGLEIWAAKKSFIKGGGYTDMSDADYAQSLADNAPDLTDKNIVPIPGITPVVLESKEQTDYVPNLTKLAADEGCKMIIAVGYMLSDATYQVAKDYPATDFMLIDAVPSDATTFAPLPNLPNLVDYLFKEEQCGYLVGAIAGMATKTNKVGFIGGIAVPAVQRYEAGFMAGLKTTNPTAYGTGGKNVADVYAGSFGDQPHGKLIAQTMIAQKCDILFHAAGATGNGMFEALKEAGGPAKGLWGLGCDVDMGKNPNLYPAGTLTCAIKHVDFATYASVKSIIYGTFTPGVVTLSLRNGGVGWAQDNVAKVLSAAQIAKINTLRQNIIDGKITPPEDPKKVSAWTAPTGF